MSRHHYFYTPPRVSGERVPVRRGLTLIEILIAVSLMTIIMLAAVRVLTYVSHTLTKTQNAMVIAGRARTAQMQIDRDLDCFTAPLTPPLRFNDAQGYVQIVEGLGSHYGRLFHDSTIGWGLKDIAVNSETGAYDSTVGDCDDVIMFTARAPEGSMFRGLVGGVIMESKEAEICIFLRGTTLYRRVLLIIPDEQLQYALHNAEFDDGGTPTSRYTLGARPATQGYGFYRDFDVSARLEWDAGTSTWRVKANTLADLTRRENRFGHSFQNLSTITNNPLPFPYGIYNNAAWYQLRLPTLAECTMDDTQASWRMGKQIVTKTNMYDMLNSQLRYTDRAINNDWGDQPANTFPKSALKPYLDYWNNPLPWANIDSKTSSLLKGADVFDGVSTSNFQFKQRTNEDVLLTNVIGFDIKVWDQESKGFIDLGEFKNTNNFKLNAVDTAKARVCSKSLGSQGFYGALNKAIPANESGCYANALYGLLPCVYDTWTDAYENDATGIVRDTNNASIWGIAVAPPAGLDGAADIMEHVDQWRCPPPYNVPLTGLQIKIRVFDPNSNNIREVTIRKNFTQ